MVGGMGVLQASNETACWLVHSYACWNTFVRHPVKHARRCPVVTTDVGGDKPHCME